MIVLNDDYAIDFDELNIILYKRIKGKGGNRKFHKGSYYEPTCYPSDFKSLAYTLIKDNIYCSTDDYSILEDITIAIDDFKNEISNKLDLLLEEQKR